MYARATLLSVISTLWIAGASAAQEQRIALVVGVANYDHISSLRNPHNDAQLIHGVLTDIGFDAELVLDPDQRTLEDRIIAFKQRLEPAGEDAVGLFYYAGHAVQANEVNYLIPRDAAIGSVDELAVRAVEANWVYGLMDLAGVGAKVIVLDACRDNPFASDWVSDSRSAATRGLIATNPPRGSMLMYSTAPGAVALDGTGDFSPFAEVFAEKVQVPNLRAESMFVDVATAVADATDEAQEPWIESSLRGEFYLGGRVDGGDAGALIEPTEFERMYWDLIADSADPDDFEDYLENFPDGAFVEEANARIAELTAGAGGPAPQDANFRVIDAVLGAEPAEYSGRCPATVNFRGQISAVGGSGLVSYRFVRSDGEPATIETMEFDGPGTQEISTSWTIGASGERVEGWVELEVYDPTEVASGRTAFAVNCAEEVDPGGSGGGSRYVIPDRRLTDVIQRDPVDANIRAAAAATLQQSPARTAILRYAARAAAPAQIAPAANAVFDNFPRTTNFRWEPVSGAESYGIEIDAYGACQAGAWCADVGGRTFVQTGLTETRFTQDFVGAQPGRWRVWAIYGGGREGAKSGWRAFRYTR